MSTEMFDQKLKEQKSDIIKWRELETGKIYAITNANFITTQYGDACIITLHSDDNDQDVWAPSALRNKLQRESDKPFPRYVRSKGLVKNKNNTRSYFGFDLV